MSGWFLLLLILIRLWMLYLALVVNRIVSWNSCNCASAASEMKFLLCWEIWSWISDIVLYNEIYCELLTFCMAVIIEKTAVLTQQHSWKWVIRMFMLLTGNDVDIIPHSSVPHVARRTSVYICLPWVLMYFVEKKRRS